MNTKNSIVKLNLYDTNNLLEWYRASHHGFRCGKSISSCHATKKKILGAAQEISGVRR
jgi:hypothetical protein